MGRLGAIGLALTLAGLVGRIEVSAEKSLSYRIRGRPGRP
jgi:hypothetical protein